MSLYVLDTDVLTLFARSHPLLNQRVLRQRWDELAITVITVEEQVCGWFTALRRANQPQMVAFACQSLAEAIQLLSQWRMLLFTIPAID
jgi:tRNA(fMet)-specific endonuclease VapC